MPDVDTQWPSESEVAWMQRDFILDEAGLTQANAMRVYRVTPGSTGNFDPLNVWAEKLKAAFSAYADLLDDLGQIERFYSDELRMLERAGAPGERYIDLSERVAERIGELVPELHRAGYLWSSVGVVAHARAIAALLRMDPNPRAPELNEPFEREARRAREVGELAEEAGKKALVLQGQVLGAIAKLNGYANELRHSGARQAAAKITADLRAARAALPRVRGWEEDVSAVYQGRATPGEVLARWRKDVFEALTPIKRIALIALGLVAVKTVLAIGQRR